MSRVNQCFWSLLLGTVFVNALQETWLPLTTSSDSGSPSTCRLCYRRILAGKTVPGTRVRRAFQCRNLQDCRRGCNREKSFPCSGFNYRKSGLGWRGRCELTSMPYLREGIDGDFVEDPRCDYYERYVSCSSPRFPLRVSGGLAHGLGGPPCSLDSSLDSSGANLVLCGPPYRSTNDIPLPLARELAHYPRVLESANGDRSLPFLPARRREFSPENPVRVELIDAYPANIQTGVLPKPHGNADDRPVVFLGTSWVSYGGKSYAYRGSHGGLVDAPDDLPDRPRLSETLSSKNSYDCTRPDDCVAGYRRTPQKVAARFAGWCSFKVEPGSRLAKAVLRATHLVANVEQCERLCIEEKMFFCASFSYRYDVTPTDPTDNCLLSDAPYGKLHLYTDTEPNQNDDIYSVSRDSKDCEAGRRKIPAREFPEECFWRLRSGFDLPPNVARTSLVVQDLGECQAACAAWHAFPCKSFAYRHLPKTSSARDVGPNCFLTSSTSREMDLADMPDVDGTDLYERGKFGQGCAPYFPVLGEKGRVQEEDSRKTEQACYSAYRRPCKLAPTAVLLSLRLNSESECRQKCSLMRRAKTVPCVSFSYGAALVGSGDNCFLSDVAMTDLRPGLDYVHDDRQVLYAWKVLDPWCRRRQSIGDNGDAFEDELSYADIRPTLSDFSPGFYPRAEPATLVPGDRANTKANAIEPRRPMQDEGYEFAHYHHLDPSSGNPEFYPPDPFLSLHGYTVNGYPCKNGTVCQQNSIIGFWSCETEGSRYGEWDYCCQPQHRCGFSHGHSYPWCYVGPKEDQWRQCSELYYPYLTSPRPSFGWNYAKQDSPDNRRTLYSARAWPILYLHQQPPPNCTDSSLRANTHQRGL